MGKRGDVGGIEIGPGLPPWKVAIFLLIKAVWLERHIPEHKLAGITGRVVQILSPDLQALLIGSHPLGETERVIVII